MGQAIKLVIEQEDHGASKALRNYYTLMNKTEKAAREVAKSSRAAGKAGKRAGDAASAGARKANTGLRGTKKGFDDISTSASAGITNIGRWVTGFIGIAGITKAIQGMNESIKETNQLTGEMFTSAIELEKLSLQIAHLRQDTSPTGISNVQRDLEKVAKEGKVTLPVAGQALFFAESAMGAGSEQAMSGAINIAKFAGPPQLTPEETKLLPKLFSVLKADNEKKQMEVLNKLAIATGGSIAQVGEYLEPFIGVIASDVARGYNLNESLARMTASIEVEGSISKAGQLSRRASEVASGRNEKALGFLSAAAKEKGFDFTKLPDPQRLEFARGLYHEHERAGTLDTLKTQLDAKGYAAFLQLFSGTGESKYFEMLPRIAAGGKSNAVEEMFQNYKETLTAKQVGLENESLLAAAKTGRKKEGSAVLNEITEEILKQTQANVKGLREHSLVWLGKKTNLSKRHIAQILVKRNIDIAMERLTEQADGDLSKLSDHPEYEELSFLKTKMSEKPVLSIKPKFVQRLYEATEGFSLYKGGDPVEERGVFESYQEDTFGPYQRGMNKYFGRDENTETARVNEVAENIRSAAEKLETAAGRLDKSSQRFENTFSSSVGGGPD
jgi:hypothetical protein